MKAYIYQAALLCETCGIAQRAELAAAGKAPTEPDAESTYDSDDYPKGPFPDGGGEADSPQYCDNCCEFLENPLTPDGVEYVREHLAMRGHIPTQKLWREFYAADLEQSTPLFDQDRSSVFPRELLDDAYASQFPKPWLFETDAGIAGFDSEDDACAAQRDYRVARGFDPVTGERK